MVIERRAHAMDRGIIPRAHVTGWAMHMNGNRNPNPSLNLDKPIDEDFYWVNNIPSKYTTVKGRLKDDIAYLQIYRPEANNTINEVLIEEFKDALHLCMLYARIVILEGLPHVFCFGADFKGITQGKNSENDPKKLYELWQALSQGPYVSIAIVRGQANAGGIGFVSSCDIVLAEQGASFSLYELFFSLMPACVLPFLIQKIGWRKAHYLTLMAQPITVIRAK